MRKSNLQKKKIKYWAFFESTASFTLLSNEEYEQNMASADFKSSGGYEYQLNLIPFETLAAAKEYLLFHLKGEIADARMAVDQIKRFKAKR